MFDSIYFNGNEYNQMWFNGELIWEKEVVSPNVIITYVNTGTSAVSSYDTGEFDIIDKTLPYSINGVKTNLYTFPVGASTLKLVNLKPFTQLAGIPLPIVNIELLDLSGTTNLRYVFSYYKYDNIRTYTWSPQNFIFNQNPTDISGMFSYCRYLTDEDFAEVLPILETLDTSRCTDLSLMFIGCQNLTELDLSWLDTSNVDYYTSMFYNVKDCTIYISDKWTLGTESDFGNGTNLTFVRNGEIVDNNVYGDIVLTTQSLYATENVESSLGIRLSQQPTNNQTVNYVYTSEFETWSGSCTFTSDDWDVMQYIEFVPALDGVYTDRTDTITFTSDNVASVNCTIYVMNTEQEEVEEETYLIDFTQETAPVLPSWFAEETKDATYYFEHGNFVADASMYGLVSNNIGVDSVAWSCYKVVAPKTSGLAITFSDKTMSTNNGFYIHSTSDATQPTYSSSTDRILEWGTNSLNINEVVVLDVIAGETYYLHFQHKNYSTYNTYGVCISSIEILLPIESINGFAYDVDLNNIEQQEFTVSPIIEPMKYYSKDLEIVYDSNYMSIDEDNFTISLLDGCQGMSHTVTYRSKTDNSISKSFTFYVNPNLEINYLIDFTQSTAPTLPSYMTLDGQGTYTFGHGMFMADVYGLCSKNKASSSTTAYIRYKYVAPASGDLTFTYRFDSGTESNYDYMTVHVDNSTSQPTYSSATNRVITTKGSSAYKNADGTASVSITKGTTYYIHIQYRKDNSGNKGLDKGCIRTIELK